MVIPCRCLDALRAWIGMLTMDDHEKLQTWGISAALLGIANEEVSRNLLCVVARFWKLDCHVFCFSLVELMLTLEEA